MGRTETATKGLTHVFLLRFALPRTAARSRVPRNGPWVVAGANDTTPLYLAPDCSQRGVARAGRHACCTAHRVDTRDHQMPANCVRDRGPASCTPRSAVPEPAQLTKSLLTSAHRAVCRCSCVTCKTTH